jgi:hypothetical protein
MIPVSDSNHIENNFSFNKSEIGDSGRKKYDWCAIFHLFQASLRIDELKLSIL